MSFPVFETCFIAIKTTFSSLLFPFPRFESLFVRLWIGLIKMANNSLEKEDFRSQRNHCLFVQMKELEEIHCKGLTFQIHVPPTHQVLSKWRQTLDKKLVDLGVIDESLRHEVWHVGVARPVRHVVAEELAVQRGNRRRTPTQLQRCWAGNNHPDCQDSSLQSSSMSKAKAVLGLLIRIVYASEFGIELRIASTQISYVLRYILLCKVQ